MREIKFRAWGSDCLVWDKYDSSIKMWNWEYIKHDFDLWVDDEKAVIMQYTGLKDKNGKEIYEGDILGFYSEGKRFLTAPVSWIQSVCLMRADIGLALTTPIPEDLYEEIANSEYEVIGNIYEGETA